MLTQSTLPYPKIGAEAAEHTLTEDLILEQWIIPAGTVVVLRQTRDFGWVHLPPECRDKRGFVIPRRIFQW